MRIALCFFGLPPMMCNKHVQIKKDLSHYCWTKNFIEINKPDIFIHCWDKKDNEGLITKYSPKLHVFENTRLFDTQGERNYDYPNCTTNNMFLSQAYSARESVRLKHKYEKYYAFKYDLVVMSRIDMLWLRPINIKNLDSKYFYIPNWNQRNKKINGTYLNNITTIERNYRKILDYWFISKSEYINYFANLFDFIPEYIKHAEKHKIKSSNHSLKKDYLVKIGLWDKVKYLFYEGYDFNVQRYFYEKKYK